MASFHAYDFIFDEIPSQNFDLKIINFGTGGIFNGKGSSNVKIYSQKIARKPRLYYLGRTQEPVLEFSLTFGRSKEVSALDRNLISKWLFGRNGYKKLQILQDDLEGKYFNCFLTDPEPLYIGNVNYAFTCKVVCDSPFAYGETKTISRNYFGPPWLPYLSIYNNSSDEEYIYPQITIDYTCDGSGQIYGFSIANNTESGRQSIYIHPDSYLPVNSGAGYLEIDCNYQTITYRTRNVDEHSIANGFNMKWTRLLPGENIMQFSTEFYASVNVSAITYSFNERFKVGG